MESQEDARGQEGTKGTGDSRVGHRTPGAGFGVGGTPKRVTRGLGGDRGEPTSSGQMRRRKCSRSSWSEKSISHVLGRFSSLMSGGVERDTRVTPGDAEVS